MRLSLRMVVGDIVGVLGFSVLAFAVLGTEFLSQPRCVRLAARGERGGLKLNRLSCAALSVIVVGATVKFKRLSKCNSIALPARRFWHNRVASDWRHAVSAAA